VVAGQQSQLTHGHWGDSSDLGCVKAMKSIACTIEALFETLSGLTLVVSAMTLTYCILLLYGIAALFLIRHSWH
jgi:hypothetical protein